MSDESKSKVVLLMKKKFQNGEYNEAQQMLQTLHFRLLKERNYNEATKLLSESASVLLEKQQIKEAIEIVNDLINIWKTHPSDKTFNKTRSSILHELFCMIPENNQQYKHHFMRYIYEWISQLKKTHFNKNQHIVQEMNLNMIPLYKSYGINIWDTSNSSETHLIKIKTALPVFNTNSPIISRANTTTQKQSAADSFSLKKIICATFNCIVYGYCSNINLNLPSTVTIPMDIKKLCSQFFAGNFPSHVYDDTFINFNKPAKMELIDILLNVLFNNFNMNLNQLSLRRIVYLGFLCIDDPNDAASKNVDVEYMQLTYLSLILSLTEITYFYDALQCENSEKTDKQTEVNAAIYSTDIRFEKMVNLITMQVKQGMQQSKYYETQQMLKALTQGVYIHTSKLLAEGAFILMKHKIEAKISWTDNSKNQTINVNNNAILANMLMSIERNEKHEPNYHLLIIRIALQRTSGRVGLLLLYSLLTENDKYYQLYQKYSSLVNGKYFVDDIKWFMKDKSFTALEITYLRKLLKPAISWCTSGKAINILIDSGTQKIVEQLMDFLNRREQLVWLWLYKELECVLYSGVYDANNLMERILLIVEDAYGTEFEQCENTAADIVLLLSEKFEMEMVYTIRNFNRFSNFLTFLLESEKHCIVVWRILNKEMENGFHDEKYKYYKSWINFIECHVHEFKMSLIANINILKKKNKGNLEIARAHLVTAINACYKINRALCEGEQLPKFSMLYAKIEKTKIVQPILQDLRIS